MQAILSRQLGVLEEIAYANCRIKAGVVSRDPTETNERRILNYGHTIGHAVESASNFELLHGQAVAIGIVGAGLIEKELGLSDDKQLDRIKKVLQSLGMPLKIPADLTKDAVVDIIKRDKKAINKWPRFVLLDSIGKVYCKDGQWAHEVAQPLVEKVLDRLY